MHACMHRASGRWKWRLCAANSCNEAKSRMNIKAHPSEVDEAHVGDTGNRLVGQQLSQTRRQMQRNQKLSALHAHRATLACGCDAAAGTPQCARSSKLGSNGVSALQGGGRRPLQSRRHLQLSSRQPNQVIISELAEAGLYAGRLAWSSAQPAVPKPKVTWGSRVCRFKGLDLHDICECCLTANAPCSGLCNVSLQLLECANGDGMPDSALLVARRRRFMAEPEPELVSKRYSSNSFPRSAESPCAAPRHHLHGQATSWRCAQAVDWKSEAVDCSTSQLQRRSARSLQGQAGREQAGQGRSRGRPSCFRGAGRPAGVGQLARPASSFDSAQTCGLGGHSPCSAASA